MQRIRASKITIRIVKTAPSAQQHAKDGCQFIAKWLQKPARDSIACFMTVDLKTMHSIPDEFNSEIQNPQTLKPSPSSKRAPFTRRSSSGGDASGLRHLSLS